MPMGEADLAPVCGKAASITSLVPGASFGSNNSVIEHDLRPIARQRTQLLLCPVVMNITLEQRKKFDHEDATNEYFDREHDRVR